MTTKLLKSVIKKHKNNILNKNIKNYIEKKIIIEKPEWQKTKEQRKPRRSWVD